MAITHTGNDGADWDFDQPSGVFTVGSSLANREVDGVTFGVAGFDELLVNGASVLTLVSNRLDFDAYLGIGAGNSADGSVTIDGIGSALVMTGTGQEIGGTSVQIGVGGGSGQLSLTNGGAFTLNDPTPNENVDDATFAGGEGATVGSRAGSVGEISLSGASSFAMTGTASGLAVGTRAGVGTIRVTDDSTFEMINLGDKALDPNNDPLYDLSADMRIGRGMEGGVGGEGLLEITTGGTVSLGGLTGAHKHGATIHVGREGSDGTINVLSGGTLNVHAADAGAELMVGYRDIGSQGNGAGSSHGTLLVDDADVNITNLDGNAALGFGLSGATGGGTVQNGGKIQLSADVVSEGFANAFLFVGASLNNAHGTGGNGSLTITGAGSQVDLTGEASQVFIGSVFNDLNSAGDGEILVEESGKLTLTAVFNQIQVGGHGTGAKGLLKVQGGGEVDVGGGDVTIHAAGTGASARIEVDGEGSVLDGIGFLGIGRYDDAVAAGAAGRLTVSNGGAVGNAGAAIHVGQGGVVAGRNGTLIGDVEFKNGGNINMLDGAFGTLTFSGPTAATGATALAVKLDIGAAGNDRLVFDGSFANNSDVAVTLTSVGGFKFSKGQQKVLATLNAGDIGNGDLTVTVLGQQSDFSYYVGRTASPNNVSVIALNNGNTASAANAGVLDYGTAGAGKLVYNAVTQAGTVSGGKFGAEGGLAYKLDDIRGTNGVDNFSVTGATVRKLAFDGRGGNDIIKGGAGADIIKGGAGNDKLYGNSGNDTFLVAGSEALGDTFSGGAGTDKMQVTGTAALKLKNFSAKGVSIEQWAGNNKGILGDASANKFDFSGLTAVSKLGAIDGAGGNDTLVGSKLADTIIGGTGKDTLSGGLGNDTFKFTLKSHSAASHAQADVILDFDDKGNDKIDLAGIYGPKLSYIGTAAFTKVGQVRINDIAGPDVIVEVNLSGSLAADFAIRLKDTTLASMGSDDFVL